MFELGVAAAWLDKDRVIIIREDKSEEPRLFDINPARQLDYTKSPLGFHGLQGKLANLIQEAIAKAPFERRTITKRGLPASLDLTKPNDASLLWGSSGSHRRVLPERGLEFGSLYNFRHGWVSFGDVIARNIHVTGEFRFNSPRVRGVPYPPWIGVMVRSQGYLATSGHLAVLRANGEVAYTQELNGTEHRDVNIGWLKGFDPNAPGFVSFDVSIDENNWSIRIGSVSRAISVADLPFVFAEGRILLEGQFCWMCVRTLTIESLAIPPVKKRRRKRR